MVKFEVYATLFVLAIIFTICDIVVSSCMLTVPSLIFSSTTAVLSFIGAYLGKSVVVEKKYTDALTYVRKNFNCANIILSVLDVLCCVLALFTGIFCLMLIFRCTIAMRIVVYINKYKTVAYAIWSLVFLHLFKKIKERKTMKTKNTLFQNILLCIIAVFGVGGFFVLCLPVISGTPFDWEIYVGGFSTLVGVIAGLVQSFSHDKVLTDEEVESKENAAALKKARKLAKLELKVKQEKELNSIAEQKLNEEKQQQQQQQNAVAPTQTN